MMHKHGLMAPDGMPAGRLQPVRTPPELPMPVLNGKTYYVDMAGNDQADGLTQATAWATLQHAADTMQPGDTTLVAPGQYCGFCVLPESSGRPDGWKAILALDPDNKPIINRRGTKTRPYRPSFVQFFGFEPEDGKPATLVTNWMIDGLVVRDSDHYGIDCVWCEHVQILNCEVYNSGKISGHNVTGIFAAFTGYYLVVGCHSENNNEHGYYINNSSHHFIYRNNVSRGNNGCGYHLNGDRFAGHGVGLCEHGMYEGNWADNNGHLGGASINFDGLRDGVVRNNIITNARAGGITFFNTCAMDTSRDIDVYDNTFVMASGNDSRNTVNLCVDSPDPFVWNLDDGRSGSVPNDRSGTALNLRFWGNVIAGLDDDKHLFEAQRGLLTEAHGVEMVGNLFVSKDFADGLDEDTRLEDSLAAKWQRENAFEADAQAVFNAHKRGNYKMRPDYRAYGVKK